eukprot:GHVU01128328.1.p1 GENE.GHVU01128328.1~~GHVU01128328.1.p1  ORF type:complete len:189 (+),score=40.98 GHVU01128328.1:430-996(+)
MAAAAVAAGGSVRLIASGGEALEVPRRVACQSTFIASLLSDGEEDNTVHVQVTAPTLKKVIDYCTHHIDDTHPPKIETPLKNPIKAQPLLGAFDKDFLEQTVVEDLFELVQAACYLHVQPLQDLCSAKLADLMRGRTLEEVRKLLKIENDFAPEEEQRVRAENAWCEPREPEEEDSQDDGSDDESGSI